jgi:hypothetical protein
MAGVTRGKKRYFYQSCNIKGRRTKQYLGSGQKAEEAAAAIEHRRKEKAVQHDQLQAMEMQHAEATAPLNELCELTDLLMNLHFPKKPWIFDPSKILDG